MRLVLILIALLNFSFISLDNAMKKAGYSSVQLEKSLFGEYVIDAEINNKNFELMVSLNISQTFIDKILADKYEFNLQEITNRNFSLNGDEGEMFAVEIDNFTLGNIKSNENEIGAIDFANFKYLKQLRVEGILGKSFLTRHGAVLDIATEKLYLKN